MSLAQTFDYQPGLTLIPAIVPTVFAIDEDTSVRESLEIVIRDVPSEDKAEVRATVLGWKIGLMAGCPACEEWWKSRQGEGD